MATPNQWRNWRGANTPSSRNLLITLFASISPILPPKMQTSTEPLTHPLTHPFTFSTRKQNDCRSDVTTLPGMEEEEDAEEEGGWVGRTDWAESSLAPWSVSAPLLFSSSTPLFLILKGSHSHARLRLPFSFFGEVALEATQKKLE